MFLKVGLYSVNANKFIVVESHTLSQKMTSRVVHLVTDTQKQSVKRSSRHFCESVTLFVTVALPASAE